MVYGGCIIIRVNEYSLDTTSLAVTPITLAPCVGSTDYNSFWRGSESIKIGFVFTHFY